MGLQNTAVDIQVCDSKNKYDIPPEQANESHCFRLEEHDTAVMEMSFSHDDCLLATMGGLDDNKLVVWDMSNGYIVAILPRLPLPTACISFAGFVRDVKRRDTPNYQLVSAGNGNIVFWSLDPYAGQKTGSSVLKRSIHNLY